MLNSKCLFLFYSVRGRRGWELMRVWMRSVCRTSGEVLHRCRRMMSDYGGVLCTWSRYCHVLGCCSGRSSHVSSDAINLSSCKAGGHEGARVLKWPLTLSGEHLIHTWFIQGEFERDQNRWVQSIDALHFPFKHILFNQRVIFICFYWNNTLQCKVVVSDRWLEFFENCSWDLTLLTMFSHSTVMQNNQTKWPRRVLRESTFTFGLRI